jgi:hypothetical protein
MADPNQIDQQRRIINDTRADAGALLDLEARIRSRLMSFERLQLTKKDALDPAAFEGTGTSAEEYLAAVQALAAFQALDPAVWAALEKFAR